MIEALPGVLGNKEKWYLFQGNRGTKTKFWGEQRQYCGTGNIRKQIFAFWGTGEQANLFQGNKGTGTTPGRVSWFMNHTSVNTEIVITLTKLKHSVPKYRINKVRIEKRLFEMSQICLSYNKPYLRHILQQINKKNKLVWGVKWKQQRLSEIVIDEMKIINNTCHKITSRHTTKRWGIKKAISKKALKNSWFMKLYVYKNRLTKLKHSVPKYGINTANSKMSNQVRIEKIPFEMSQICLSYN